MDVNILSFYSLFEIGFMDGM